MAQCAWPLNKYLSLPLSCLLGGNEDFPVHIWSCSPTLKHQGHALSEHLQGSNWSLYLTHLLSFICLVHMDKYEHMWKVHSHNKTSRSCIVRWSTVNFRLVVHNAQYWNMNFQIDQSLTAKLANRLRPCMPESIPSLPCEIEATST